MGKETGFGIAHHKKEGGRIKYDSKGKGNSKDEIVYMELRLNLTRQSREDIHREVDEFLDELEKSTVRPV